MNPIKSVQSLVSNMLGKPSRSAVVQRLLNLSHITVEEAEVLLTTNITVAINKVEMSSGAKIVGGDDNEVNYK